MREGRREGREREGREEVGERGKEGGKRERWKGGSR